jgi:metallophosphoesterase (TIGR03767 family)
MRLALLGLLAVAAALLAGAGASAQTTLRETVAPAAGSGFRGLDTAAGERYVVRRPRGLRARAARARERRSLVLFAQLTDPQIADEMSPARVDFADPAGGEIRSSWRPQEALGLHVFDQAVRSVNANRRSPVRQAGGRRARLAFAITTGDLADNQQLNETRWFRTVLDGGTVDPFSGKPIGPKNQCGTASAQELAALNADVEARRYTGVQDYDDYAAAPDTRKAGFWDPDAAPAAGGAYAAFPRYAGLMERAQARFRAAGLRVPWYVARGNHDGLVQGNAPASEDLFRAIATGCLKVFPNAVFDPARFAGASDDELFAAFSDPAFITQLLAGGRAVSPDPDRRFVTKAEYRRLMGSGRAHGFRFTPRRELRASRRTASYYAWSPRRGLRFVSLDTVAEGGGSNGNLDEPQYRWLRGELRRARRRDQLVVVFGHHTLATMDNRRADERAGACEPADEPGCDSDPRRSTPIHRGLAGRRTVAALLRSSRNVIGYVAGHTHANRARYFGGRRGFWEINTASHIDWPQQSRLIEVMDNRDGTLSLFGTLIDHAGPATAPAPGPATAFTTGQLASLARMLAFNDPQREGIEGSAGGGSKTGGRRDRNVELLLRDPRS